MVRTLGAIVIVGLGYSVLMFVPADLPPVGLAILVAVIGFSSAAWAIVPDQKRKP